MDLEAVADEHANGQCEHTLLFGVTHRTDNFAPYLLCISFISVKHSADRLILRIAYVAVDPPTQHN